jgi:hypothetical protein
MDGGHVEPEADLSKCAPNSVVDIVWSYVIRNTTVGRG